MVSLLALLSLPLPSTPVAQAAGERRPSISDPVVRESLSKKLERALRKSGQIGNTRRGKDSDFRISGVGAKPKPAVKPKAKPKPPPKPKPDPITLVIERAVQRTYDETLSAELLPVISTRWSYQGEGGPDHWGQLRGDFMRCTTGSRQSPIALDAAIAVSQDAPVMSYRPSRFEVLDDGRNVVIKLDPRNRLSYGRIPMRLTQIRLHRPGEHWLGEEPPDMSVHLIHESQHGPALVVAVSLMIGVEPNPALQSIIDALPLEPGGRARAIGRLDASQFLPPLQDRGYYVYDGSLTTPPCTEGIRWFVMAEPVSMSSLQLRTFVRLFDKNARPLQAVSGRRIKRSM